MKGPELNIAQFVYELQMETSQTLAYFYHEKAPPGLMALIPVGAIY